MRTSPERLPVLGDLLPKIEMPVQIIAGARGPVFPPVNAEYLLERLPDRTSTPSVRYILSGKSARTYAALVTSWWDGGYTKAGSRRERAPEQTPEAMHGLSLLLSDLRTSNERRFWR